MRVDDHRYNFSPARKAIATIDDTDIRFLPLHPQGTVIGAAHHPWQRKNNWHLNHSARDQGICRLRRRTGELCRLLELEPEHETAAYQLSLQILNRHPKGSGDCYILAAIAGVIGTIRRRHLPITFRRILQAAGSCGRGRLRWRTISRYLSSDAHADRLLGRQPPMTYLPQLLEQALIIIAAHDGHAPNGGSLRAQLTHLSETLLATAHPRPGAHPQIVAATSVYLACHELLYPCPIRQHSFEPLVNEYSLRTCRSLDFHGGDCRR